MNSAQFKTLRIELGFGVNQLAKELGVSRQTIFNIESHKKQPSKIMCMGIKYIQLKKVGK